MSSSEIIDTARAFIDAERPVVQSAVRDMAAQPKSIPAKLKDLLAGLWRRLTETGLIGLCVQKAKELFAALTRSAPTDETLPLLDGAGLRSKAAASGADISAAIAAANTKARSLGESAAHGVAADAASAKDTLSASAEHVVEMGDDAVAGATKRAEEAVGAGAAAAESAAETMEGAATEALDAADKALDAAAKSEGAADKADAAKPAAVPAAGDAASKKSGKAQKKSKGKK